MPVLSPHADQPSSIIDPPPPTTTTVPPPIRQHTFPLPKIRLHLDDIPHAGTALFLSHTHGHTDLSTQIQNVLNLLYRPDSPRPGTRSVTFVLHAFAGVAYTTGTELDGDHKEIHVSLDYIHGRRGLRAEEIRDEILGVVNHELVHCFQYSADGTCNAGLIEGMADYVRLKSGLAAKHWKREASGSWDGGYQHTGYFLDWLERKCGAGTVRSINAMLGEMSEYDGDRLFRSCCGGKTAEAWWGEYREELVRKGGETATEERKTVPTGTPPRHDTARGTSVR